MSGRGLRPRAAAMNYNQGALESNAAGGTPVWMKKGKPSSSSGRSEEREKENSKQRKVDNGKGKAAPPAERGRNAGLTVVPIKDVKKEGKGPAGKQQPKQSGKGSGGSSERMAAAATTTTRDKAPSVPHKAPASMPARPAAGKASSGSGAKQASNDSQGAGAKRKAASVGAVPAPRQPPAQAAEVAAPSALKRHKPAQAALAAAPAPATAVDAPSDELAAVDPPLPGSNAEGLVAQFSANFQALQEEYLKLQEQYEDLKAAKIDREVQQLLEQHSKYVVEHGQKAAELADHWRLEAERQATLAAEAEAPQQQEQLRALQADLATCQQALLDMEAAGLEKERRIAMLAARNSFLERFARVPQVVDKCLQTDMPAQAEQAQQMPSLQSSGLEVLEARALLPEGAAGGSIYKRPKVQAQTAGGAADLSYTVHTQMPAPTGQQQQPAAGMNGVPISGSDMQLTGPQQAAAAVEAAVQAVPAVPQAPSGLTAESLALAAHPQQQAACVQQAQPAAARRASVAAAAPLERELEFSSLSHGAALRSGAEEGSAAAAPPAQPPPSALPAPPRELALTALTGLVATPVRGNTYKYRDPATGYEFELGPAPPDSAPLDQEDGGSDFDVEDELVYRPLNLGRAAAALPSFLKGEIAFSAAQQKRFLEQVMEALAKASRRRQQ